MKFTIITLFPQQFSGFLKTSIVGRAISKKVVSVNIIDLRDFAIDPYGSVDDKLYGGGAGMLLRPEPLDQAVTTARKFSPQGKVVFFTPQGETFNQSIVQELIQDQPSEFILICGHYKGIDERIRETLVERELSIGDYILTGGELPAMIFIDALSRWIPTVLGDIESARSDSFSEGLLNGPEYTRPLDFLGRKVPEIILSGHHQNILKWKREQALKRTFERRPDLLTKKQLSKEDHDFLNKLQPKEKRC